MTNAQRVNETWKGYERDVTYLCRG